MNPQVHPPEGDPRTRILQAAKELFARKGYSATSLRELTAAAGVNLAMVHYYFGSKTGVLEAIFEEFFQQLQRVVAEIERFQGPPEAKIRTLVERMVEWHRANPFTARAVLSEIALETPEMADYKAQKARQIFATIERVFPLTGRPEEPKLDLQIYGPAIGGAILWHFIIRPVFERAFGVHFDDAFYRRYTDELTTLLTRGLLGRLERKGD